MDKKEQIEYAHFLIERISKDFLLEGSPYIIQEGFENIRDLIILYGKQSNLLESVLVLIENNMAEEAFILMRSLLNNFMLLVYLSNDDSKQTRHKEFSLQPIKTYLKFLYDMRKGVERGWLSQDKLIDLELKIKIFEDELENHREFFYKKNGKKSYNTRPISISKMANSDEFLYNYYISHYREGSAYEHSDPTSLKIYKDKFMDDNDVDGVFKLDLSKTDIELEENVLKTAIGIYTMSYLTLLKLFSNDYEYLIEDRKTKLEEIALIMHASSI
ncbi:DUF5677 domain-containing protein [Peribacillus frigoritolerans]|uniref:DUF5677 domain-containing protein n=1 Tax=Peribacillus frigoritolerans TaxID=450367 RepID=UPI003DA187C6